MYRLQRNWTLHILSCALAIYSLHILPFYLYANMASRLSKKALVIYPCQVWLVLCSMFFLEFNAWTCWLYFVFIIKLLHVLKCFMWLDMAHDHRYSNCDRRFPVTSLSCILSHSYCMIYLFYRSQYRTSLLDHPPITS